MGSPLRHTLLRALQPRAEECAGALPRGVHQLGVQLLHAAGNKEPEHEGHDAEGRDAEAHGKAHDEDEGEHEKVSARPRARSSRKKNLLMMMMLMRGNARMVEVPGFDFFAQRVLGFHLVHGEWRQRVGVGLGDGEVAREAGGVEDLAALW